MRSPGRRGLLVSIALFTMPISPAWAYVRTTTQDDPSVGLFWRYRTVIIRPAPDTCQDLPQQTVRDAIDRAMTTWSTASGCTDFRFEDGGYPSGLSTNGFHGREDGENRVVWHNDTWPEALDSDGTIAVTTVVYHRYTGEILDADVDVNGVSFTWTDTTVPDRVQTDVQNVLTHEFGHVLGLGHPDVQDATMYPYSPPGDLAKRTLAQDDIAGICFVYPKGQLSPGEPHFQTQPLTTSCSAAPGRRGSPLPLLAVVAVAMGWHRRRHRPKHRPRARQR